jgi:hypothetical protein
LLAIALAACSAPAAAPGAGTPEPGGTALSEATGEVEGLNPDLILETFGQPTGTPVAPQTMSQAEAQAQLLFHYALPAWTPAGFVLQDQVEVVLPSRAGNGAYAGVIITWLKPDESALRLQVASRPADQPSLGGAGSSQAASVNGEPAVLVQSGSASLGQARLSLAWQRSGLSYSLSADPGAVTADDLVRMAESIPEG